MGVGRPNDVSLIPFHEGKAKVTVRFLAPDNSMAGGVFGCRIVKKKEKLTAAKVLMKTVDPFYQQHIMADVLLIVSSEKVSRHALREAEYLTKKMLANTRSLPAADQ